MYLNALPGRTPPVPARDTTRSPATPQQTPPSGAPATAGPVGLPPSGHRHRASPGSFSPPRAASSPSAVPEPAALAPLSSHFPLTGFGRNGVNGWRVAAARWIHGRSARIAADVALTSPSLRRVGRQNRALLAGLRPGNTPRDQVLARLGPGELDAVRDQVLEHLDDAFLTNLRRHIRKARGQVRQTLRPDGRELTRTRARLVAEMTDLGQPESPLNRALERLAPALLARPLLASMGRLERDDLRLKIAAETFDCLMQPTAEQAHRTALLVAELGQQGQHAFDRIHAEAFHDLLQALAALPAHTSTAAMGRLAARHAERTGKRIERARTQLFDTFRRRNGGQFGFHPLSEQVRENSNMEYYRSLTLPGALWGTGARVLTSAAALAGGPAGLALTVTLTAVMQYVTAVTSQASTGATGAAATDLKPFDSATMPRAIIDPEVYANQRHLAATMQRIGQQALDAYTRPGNPAAETCRRTVQRLEQRGYDHAARCALAPELLALCDYRAHMLGIDTTGLDDAVPPPVRIAALLHACADDLPALPPGPLDAARCRAVVQCLIEAIDRRSPQAPPADAATIAGRTHHHAEALMRHAGLDRAAMGALLAPDTAALHAGGADFMALVHTLLQSSGLMEQPLFQSRGMLRAQYRGLYVNAVVGLGVQLAIGVAAVFGVGAATAAGTPVAGFGAAVGFAALSLAATSMARDAGALAWYSHDIASQTDAHLYREMRSPLARPVVGDAARHVEAIEKSLLANHVPLYKRRRDQLQASLRAAWEKELIAGSDLQAQQGWQMLAWLERHERPAEPAASDADDGGGAFASALAGQSMAAMHRAASAGKHRALIDTHEAGRRLVDSAAQSAQAVLQAPDPAIAATADAYRQDEKRFGVRDAYAWRARNRDHFPDAAQGDAIPAHRAIDALRARARACVDRSLLHTGSALGRADFECLKTALRTPHADDASELWIAGTARRLETAGRLVDGPAQWPAATSQTSAKQHQAWQERHRQRAARIDEHQRAMQLIARDLLALQAGRFEHIRDPLGVIRASLAHNALAGQISRHFRVNNDRAFIAFTRGTARFAGQVLPVTLRGAVTSALILGGGTMAILQAGGPHIGDIKLEKLAPDDVQELIAQGLQPTSLQREGIALRIGGLAGAISGGAMNAMQPETSPFTFQAGGQIQSFRGAFAAGDPSFASLVEAGARDAPHFAGLADPWTGQAGDPGAVLDYLATNAGATQLKLRVDRRLESLPDRAHLGAAEHARWHAAQRQSREPWNARLGGYLPSRFIHDLRYGKNARKHFDQVQADRHRLATALTVAGHRLASMGAPAHPLPGSRTHPEVHALADTMLRRLLQAPDAAALLFVGTPPPEAAAQHALLWQAAADNPWYLLRLVQFALSRADADEPHADGAWLRLLHGLRVRLTEDALRAAVPQIERQLRQAIALCGETPLPHGRWDELHTLLETTQRDTEAMAGGEARRHLRGLVAELADAVARIDTVAF